jgi:hypothetical protein
MPVPAGDLVDGGLVAPGELDGDGTGSDWWGNAWLLGGWVDRQVVEPFSAQPDQPMEVGDLDAVRPGPDLAVRLAAVSPCDVGDAELVALIAAAERLARWSAAVQVRAIAELSRRPAFGPDRGRDAEAELRSAGAQVAAELRVAQVTGERRVWVARRLVEQFPATYRALRNGEIDLRRAELIAAVADHHELRIAEVVESRVLPRAGGRTIGQHRRAIEREILIADPDGARRRHQAAAADRRVWCEPMPDGMGQVVADLTADGMALVRAMLDAAAAGMKTSRTDRGRSMDQLRADALVDLAALSLASGRLGGHPDGVALATAHGHRPHIQVTVPLSTLIGIDEHPGELVGYGPIPSGVARRIAAEGTWRRLLTDPATGRLIDYGTTRYTPPQDLRDLIIARDRECMFPTCSMPAHRGQIDHTISYPHGPTAQTNLGPPCDPHHDLKTRWGWQVDQPEEGRFIWTSPVGRRYEQEPQQIGPIITPQLIPQDTEPPDKPDPPDHIDPPDQMDPPNDADPPDRMNAPNDGVPPDDADPPDEPPF